MLRGRWGFPWHIWSLLSYTSPDYWSGLDSWVHYPEGSCLFFGIILVIPILSGFIVAMMTYNSDLLFSRKSVLVYIHLKCFWCNFVQCNLSFADSNGGGRLVLILWHRPQTWSTPLGVIRSLSRFGRCWPPSLCGWSSGRPLCSLWLPPWGLSARLVASCLPGTLWRSCPSWCIPGSAVGRQSVPNSSCFWVYSSSPACPVTWPVVVGPPPRFRYSSGKAYEIGGNWAREIPESGKLDPGITGPVDKRVREIVPARLRAGPGNGRFGWCLIYVSVTELILEKYYRLRSSYVEGTTFSGGLPLFVSEECIWVITVYLYPFVLRRRDHILRRIASIMLLCVIHGVFWIL